MASESNFTLASEDLHSPGGENMKNRLGLHVDKVISKKKEASAEGASRIF